MHDGAKTNSGWIPELDSLRAIAALLVVVGHYAVPSVSHGWMAAIQSSISHSALPNIAVTLFFSLSAFLLTYLATKEIQVHGRIRIGRFFLRRMLRIWPLYFLVLFVAYQLAAPWSIVALERQGLGGHWQWVHDNIPLFLLLVSNWTQALNGSVFNISMPSEFGVMWSIAVEEQFYILFPVIFYVLTRNRLTHMAALPLALLVGLGARYYFTLDPPPLPEGGGGMYYAATSYVEVFFFGGLAGWSCAIDRHKVDDFFGRILRFFAHRLTIFPLLALTVLMVVEWSSQLWPPYTLGSIYSYPMVGLVFAACLFWVYHARGSRLTTVLRYKPLLALGRISYGLYLWHLLVFRMLSVARDHLLVGGATSDAQELAFFVIYLATTVGISALSYGLFERRFLDLKARFLSREKKSQTAIIGGVHWVTLAASSLTIMVVAGGVLASTNVKITTDVPQPVVALSLESRGTTELVAQWKPVEEGVSYYEYVLKDGGGNLIAQDKISGRLSGIEFKNTQVYTAYQLTLAPCLNYGCAPVVEATYTPLPQKPLLSVKGVAPGAVTLIWPVDVAHSTTTVEMLVGADFKGIGEAQQGQTVYDIAGLSPSSSYTFRVQACIGDNCETSNVVSFSPVPQKPELTAKLVAPGAMALSWPQDATRSTTKIEMLVDGNFIAVGEAPPGQNAFTISGLTPASSYTFRAQACIEESCEISNVVTHSLAPKVPALAAKLVSRGTVRLSWPEDMAQSKTVIEMLVGGEYRVIAEVAPEITEYRATGLAPFTDYTFRVQACLGRNCVPSNVVRYKPTPLKPVLSVKRTAPDAVLLVWPEDISQSKTIIEILTGTTFAASGEAQPGQASYGISGLAPYSTYSFRVQACIKDDCVASNVVESAPIPLKPELAGNVIALGGVQLIWPDDVTRSSKKIEMKVGDEDFVVVGNVLPGVTVYNINDLSPGYPYKFRIEACIEEDCIASNVIILTP